VDKLVKSETYNQLRLNLGERIFKLKSLREWECDKWKEAIVLAANTAKELARSKTKNSRNISKLLELLNANKKDFEKYLEEKCELWLPKNKDFTNDAELIASCKQVKQELVIVFFYFHTENSLLIRLDVKLIYNQKL